MVYSYVVVCEMPVALETKREEKVISKALVPTDIYGTQQQPYLIQMPGIADAQQSLPPSTWLQSMVDPLVQQK